MRRLLNIISLGLCGLSVVSSLTAIAADDPTLRDPFWPVGYSRQPAVVTNVPEPVVAAPAPETVGEPKVDPIVIQKMAAALQAKIRSTIRVSGFMKSASGQQLATVNGSIVAEGDRLDVAVEGQTYRFRVTGISASAVNLEPVN